MDNRDFWIGILGFVGVFVLLGLLVGGSGYAGYKYGRFVERRSLTEALTQSLEGMYYTGYGDCERLKGK